MDPTNGDARLDSLEAKMQALEQRIPDSDIISRSFWKRLLTVFGYNVVIYLVILLPAFFVFGMIAAIAIPKFADTKEKAYMAAMRSDLRNLVLAEEAYFADWATYGTVSQVRAAGLWSPITGVSVTATDVTADGWAATATHDQIEQVCGVFIGTATPPHSSLIEDASPVCW